MDKPPVTFQAARILILVCAAIWLTFAGIVASGFHPSYPGEDPLQWILAGLAFLAGLALLAFNYFLGRRDRRLFYLGAALLFLIFIFTLADQVGWIDLAVLAVTLSALVLLLTNRRWYFRQASEKKRRPRAKSGVKAAPPG